MVSEIHDDLADLLRHQIRAFPEHADYLDRRFAGCDAGERVFVNEISGLIKKIAGNQIDRMCEDYRWLTGVILEEELRFRRTGRYRLSTFQEANTQIYSDDTFMLRYMRGLLASQIWWPNHTEMLRFFRDDFIACNTKGYTHLEIGPGHGLFLYLAASSPHCISAEGWDVSHSSIGSTRAALEALQPGCDARLRNVDLFDAPDEQFSSIAFSEVLEHLEEPRAALAILCRLLSKGGRLFVNAPINAPAPDHLYLFETPEQIVDMIAEAGLVIEKTRFACRAGVTMERARKQKLTASVGVIARKE